MASTQPADVAMAGTPGPQPRRRTAMALRRVLPVVLTLAIVAPFDGTPARAQHENAADLQDGERAYQASCANCHGPDGNLIAGNDLFRGQFRRTLTDAEIGGIIRNGIPNTPMPATSMSAEQAAQIVAYLRSLAATKRGVANAGDATRGRAVFEGASGCTGCHRVNGSGSRVAPDLSRVGTGRRTAEIERAILDPAADVLPTNRSYRVVTQDGTVVTGRLLNHDTFTVQLIDTNERLRSFVKADLREHGFAPTPMPSYRGRLTPQEVADVVAYLATLR
jgi:putative heme-binding domain-containing protein